MPLDGSKFPGRRFTDDQEATLIALRESGLEFSAVAEAIGVASVGAVRVAYYRAVERAAAAAESTTQTTKAKQRDCLRCLTSFLSEHAGHRMCADCRTGVARLSPLACGAASIAGPIRLVER